MFSLRICHAFAILLTFAGLHASLVAAEGRERERDVGAAHALHQGASETFATQHFDTRFGHNRFYYNPGYRLGERPKTGIAINRGRDHFWYDYGHWYRHDGTDWVVAQAPIGVFVPTLPTSYTTVWSGEVPYYYANDTYYEWMPQSDEYEIVEPPDGIENAVATGAPDDGAIVAANAKDGQSPEQESRDRYECFSYAKTESGYNPSDSESGLPADVAKKRGDFERADGACLKERGYAVK